MAKKIIQTTSAPSAIGPYSQGVQAGPFLFLSGQIGLDRQGNLVEGGVEFQAEQILNNIQAVLTEAGSRLDQVIKTTIYLTNLEDFGKVNQIYGRYFPVDPPARATVEVSRLPMDVLVEIEVMAYLD